MQTPYDQVPEDVLKQAAEDAEEKKQEEKEKKEAEKQHKKDFYKGDFKPDPNLAEHRQRRIFKRRRAGVVLSREEVKAIKEGRKKLRKEMKGRGIKSKKEFEIVAGSLGLYFDKRRGFIFWLFRHWLAALIGALLAMLLVLFVFSMITKMRGLFTISLADDMFKEGFVLSETEDFKITSTELFANPAVNVPCISIKQLPTDIDSIDGEHNKEYFAYTYYIRNEGESIVDYEWDLELTSESLNLSTAAWVMLFEDGKMRFYAHANSTTGEAEALPPKDDDTRGYIDIPVMQLAPDSDQFEVVRSANGVTYYRIVPDKFISPTLIAQGGQTQVKQKEVHKYTVVLWLEGDDVDTDNSKIGGHLGTMMTFRLKRSEAQTTG